ncbi:MAG TPA: PepSY-like domain-containing protein [Lacipirellulaceae bacterium]|nr:PepSY-like domain-containing protein [Lacipirellulaceae bacterium]
MSTKLPAVVKKAFDAKYPKATIESVDAETENGIEIYDLEFRDGISEKEADFAKDGTLLESTLVIELKDVPKDAMNAIRKAAGDAKMGRVEKVEVNCNVKDGKITKLSKAELQYAVEIAKDGKHAEVTVDPQGKVVEPPQWEADKPATATK